MSRVLAALESLKLSTRRILASRALQPLWAPFLGDSATVVMLHRFSIEQDSIVGHDPLCLATNLEFLRKRKYNIISLHDLVDRLDTGLSPLPKTVVFTIDDGYADALDIGAPIFERYQCPASVFLITGWLDGEVWLWYDAVRYLIGDDKSGSCAVSIGPELVTLQWSNEKEREIRLRSLLERLKDCPTGMVEEIVRELERSVGRKLPQRPPSSLSPTTWEKVRTWESRGLSFGAHTHRHPILANADSARVRDELSRSVRRLREEVRNPLPVFCYPNGRRSDYGKREHRILHELGIERAVTAEEGYLTLRDYQSAPFDLPRIAYREQHSAFRNQVSGLGRARLWLAGVSAQGR